LKNGGLLALATRFFFNYFSANTMRLAAFFSREIRPEKRVLQKKEI